MRRAKRKSGGIHCSSPSSAKKRRELGSSLFYAIMMGREATVYVRFDYDQRELRLPSEARERLPEYRERSVNRAKRESNHSSHVY